MKKKTIGSGIVLLSVMILVCFPFISNAYVSEFGVNENQYYPNGTINEDLSYNNVFVQAAESGCVLQGTITNTSTQLQSANVTVRAVDASEKQLWQCTFSLPAISAGDSYQFQQGIDDCPSTEPYRLRFEVSQ